MTPTYEMNVNPLLETDLLVRLRPSSWRYSPNKTCSTIRRHDSAKVPYLCYRALATKSLDEKAKKDPIAPP